MTRREEIERVALKLFAERGIDRVSMRDIAQAVGIREGGLYKHIRSKEDLAAQVFADAYRAFGIEVRRALQPTLAAGDVDAGIAAIVGTIYTAFDRDPVRLRYLLLSQHDHLPTLDLGADNPVDIVAGFIADAITRGALPEQDPALALALLLGVVLQPLVNTLYGRLPVHVGQLAPTITTVAARMLATGTPSSNRKA